MKRVMLFMVLAALLLTQCRKPSIDFPTPSETTTVSMTITAGPGSKTDITTEGGIVWSENDKIYVGDGSKYVGYLTLVGDGGDATGTFTGDVTVATGDDCTFHFYYLGHDNGVAPAADATEVTIDFSSQNIYADGGKLKNASGQHVGYGKAEHVKVEADKPVTGLQVSMKSKVAIAYFRFTRVADGDDYTDALTLRGDHIYNKMTVYFSTNTNDFDFRGEEGDIRLADGHSERYAMLVPAGTSAATLNFGGCVSGTTTLENGIEANKFYRIDSRDPIVVEVTPFVFSVASGTTVEFSPGNLWYGKAEGEDEPAFHFEGSQAYNATESFVANHIDRFYWSKTESVAYMVGKYSDAGAQTTDVFFTNDPSDETQPNTGFRVSGETAGTWRTLSSEEWRYLLNTSNNASGARTDKNRFAKANVNGVNGLLIFPDGYNNNVIIESITGVANVNTTNAGYPNTSIPADKWAAMESFGVVFLPAAGVGGETDVFYWNQTGNYNSSNLVYGGEKACIMSFNASAVQSGLSYDRHWRESVRLVRSCPAL